MLNLSPSRFVIYWLLPICLLFPGSVSQLNAQPATPAVSPPRAVYGPKPIYRPEWARQGLKGKGVVLVTIDPKTGNVTGARMLQSTGKPGARWRRSSGLLTMAIPARQRLASEDAD
jgi:hypothetical protein